MSEILFTPSQESMQRSALWRFSATCAAHHGGEPGDYEALHAWSVRDPENFYRALWDALDVIGERGEQVYRAGTSIRDTKLFPQVRLNYAENLLRDADERPALIAYGDDGRRREISRAQLRDEVSRMVQALRAEGIKPGDRVAAIVTHDIEALIAYLATAAVGAIWASCSPDFGPQAASDRLAQLEPRILLGVVGYRYGNKAIEISATLQAVAEAAKPQRVVLFGEVPPALRGFPSTSFRDWLAPYSPNEIVYERLGFDAPLVVLFSSGTTGAPKGIVHSAAGLLLQHKKELLLHCDLRPGERFFYYTTCGWMMWNWQVSGLAAGATLVSYDGNPFHPAPAALIDLIDAEDIAVFGVSAKYLDVCRKTGLCPRETHRLHSLRLVLSTGSPLLPENFDYLYRDWKAEVDLASISGGTDICGCFVGGNPLLPVRRGELKCAMLGMDVDVVDEQGKPLRGERGELVCRNAHLTVPLQFWRDEGGERFHKSYFTRLPGMWAQGDFASRQEWGGFIIHGRSDTTLNPGGVRIGTAEIYRQVETIDAVEEAVVAGQDIDGDQRVILFVRLRPGKVLDAELREEIRRRIRTGASPRHVPALIVQVQAIPRTRSGKICESAVREIINGRPVRNVDALENPEALNLIAAAMAPALSAQTACQ